VGFSFLGATSNRRLNRRQFFALVDMTRLILKTIDLGASAAFMVLCKKAFLVHFCKDIGRQLKKQVPYARQNDHSSANVT
jgi:hypothetical protein